MKTRQVAQPIYNAIALIRQHREVVAAVTRHYSDPNNAATDPAQAGWWSERGKGWFDLDEAGEALRAATIAAHKVAEEAQNRRREAYSAFYEANDKSNRLLYRANKERLSQHYSDRADACFSSLAVSDDGEVATADKYRAEAEAALAAFVQTIQATIERNCAVFESPDGLAWLEAARVVREKKEANDKALTEANETWQAARDAAAALAAHASAPRTKLADEAEAALMRDYMLTPSKLADLFKARDAGALSAI
jgi:hypothetical protein